jgi:hypothetical protein
VGAAWRSAAHGYGMRFPWFHPARLESFPLIDASADERRRRSFVLVSSSPVRKTD